MFQPNNDGIDHINIYSKGETELGRWLSNFAYSPFTHPVDGKFASVEGYWYWLLASTTHPNRESLRKLVGYAAKKSGREILPEGRSEWGFGLDFQNKIKYAIVLKLNSKPDMLTMFMSSKLPFAHYYHYGGKVVPVPQADWIVQFMEDIRKPEENEDNYNGY